MFWSVSTSVLFFVSPIPLKLLNRMLQNFILVVIKNIPCRFAYFPEFISGSSMSCLTHGQKICPKSNIRQTVIFVIKGPLKWKISSVFESGCEASRLLATYIMCNHRISCLSLFCKPPQNQLFTSIPVLIAYLQLLKYFNFLCTWCILQWFYILKTILN